MLCDTNVKSRQLSLGVELLSTLLGEILMAVCHDLFKSYRGESPTFPGLRKPEKGKSMITLGLNVCLF